MYDSALTLSRIGIILKIDADMNDPLFEAGTEYVHTNFTDLFAGSQRPMLRKFLDKAAATQKLQCVEFLQGKSFYQLKCIFLTPQQAVCIITNDTRQKEELKELEDYNMQAIIDNYQDWIWSFDTYYTLVTANKAYLNARQRSNNKPLKIGDNIMKGVDEAIYKKWLPVYERALKGETINIEEKRNENGREYFAEIHISPVYNPHQNKVIGCMGITRDVTKKKTAGIEAENYAQKLQDFTTKTSEKLQRPINNIKSAADSLSITNNFAEEKIRSILDSVDELDRIVAGLSQKMQEKV